MADDLEIRITTKNNSGGGIDAFRRDLTGLKNELKQVKAAGDVDIKATVDDRQVRTLTTTVKGLDGQNIDLTVDVDDAGVRRARDDIRDLDSIPDPVIEPDVDLSQLEQGLAGLDVSGLGQQMGGDLGGALAGALGDKLGSLSVVGGPLMAGVGIAAAAFGDDLMAGIADSMGQKRRLLMDAVQSGLPKSELQIVGREAGDAYTAGFGESLSDVRQTAILLESSLRGIDESMNLEESTKSAEALAEVFGVDIPTGARMARDMVANGLAPDVERAYAIMANAAQKYGLDQEEIFDTAAELGPMWASMGMDGARGFQILGEAAAKGQLEVGQMAELFEEFTGQLTDGSLNETMRDIGLSAEEMQNKMATGRGAEAMRDITTALLNMEDPVARNTAAADIFGESWAKVADPEIMLQLLSQADALGEVNSALEDSKAAIEESVTGWDRLGKTVESVGGAIGDTANMKLQEFYDSWDSVKGLFTDSEEPIVNVTSSIRQLEHETGVATETIAAAGEELTTTASAVVDLDSALQALTGQYDADQLMRRFQEDLEAAREATAGLTAEAYTLGEGFDITTEAGRGAEAALEDVGRSLIDMAQAHRDGSVSTAELAEKQREARATLVEVAGQMGATGEKTRELIAIYGSVPGFTKTIANYETNRALELKGQFVEALNGVPPTTSTTASFNAWGAIQGVYSYIQEIGRIPRSVNTTVTQSIRQAERRATGGVTGGITGAAAAGGVHDGWTWVGEDGPELAKLAPGSQVASNPDSMRMAAESGGYGGGSGMTVNVHVAGSILSERALAEVIRDALYRGDFDGVGGI
jgi:uncharacterized protein YoxC